MALTMELHFMNMCNISHLYLLISYSFRLASRVLLYAPSHRQDNTYHYLCYTSRGALAGTRNISRTTTTTHISTHHPVADVDCDVAVVAAALHVAGVQTPEGVVHLVGPARQLVRRRGVVAEVLAPVHLEPGRQQLRVLRQLHVEGLAEPRHVDVDHALADAVSLRSAPRRAPVQVVGEEVSAGVDERWNHDVEVWEKNKKD